MLAAASAEPVHKSQPSVLATLVLLFCLSFALPSCGPSRPPNQGGGSAALAMDSIVLVATERSSRGGRLVRVSSDGARQSSLTNLPADVVYLDRSPVFSADGAYLVFVSNRGRQSLSDTSLWIVASEGGEPRQLTKGDSVDRDPRVSPDGKWLYFSSNREGSFDIYRALLKAAEGKLEALERITNDSAQVLSPSLSPDGEEISYMAVDEEGGSSIWRARVDGTGAPTQLTPGPMDMTPAWGKDNSIAFASRAVGRNDADLFLIDADGANRRSLFDAPNTDETGPRWSQDGRYVFAIGMYRSAHDGKPILGSVIFVDMQEKERKLRSLHDPSAVESRIGLALAPVPLDSKVMHRNDNYSDALKKVLLHNAILNDKARRRLQKEK